MSFSPNYPQDGSENVHAKLATIASLLASHLTGNVLSIFGEEDRTASFSSEDVHAKRATIASLNVLSMFGEEDRTASFISANYPLLIR